MQDPGCPPFGVIVAYLFCIILSCSMILYLYRWLTAWDIAGVPPDVLAYLLAFCVIILYSFFRLARGLFPAWWQHPSGSVLLWEIVEIDGKV